MVSQGSTRITREIEIEKFITGFGGSKLHASRGHRGRSRQSANREAELGAHAFIKVCGWSALGFLG